MLPLRSRVDLGAMAMKACSTFPKAPASLEPHHQIFSVIYRTLVGGGGLTPRQRCSWCILQPQLTEKFTKLIVNILTMTQMGGYFKQINGYVILLIYFYLFFRIFFNFYRGKKLLLPFLREIVQNRYRILWLIRHTAICAGISMNK